MQHGADRQSPDLPPVGPTTALTTYRSWCVAVGTVLVGAVGLPVLLLHLAGVPGLGLATKAFVVGLGALFAWVIALEIQAEFEETQVPAPVFSRAEVSRTVRRGGAIVGSAVLATLEQHPRR